MSESPPFSFSDNVRIASAPETIKLGLGGKLGQVYGVTTPSIITIDMVRQSFQHQAINVYFEDMAKAFWFPAELIEFADHAAGTIVEIGGETSVRIANGSWSNPTSKNSFLSRFLGLFR